MNPDIYPISDMAPEKVDALGELMKQAPKGLFVEIGIREGGTSVLALECPNSSAVLGIDPYGGRGYSSKDGPNLTYGMYQDDMYSRAMERIFKRARELNKVYVSHKTTSELFTKVGATYYFGEELTNKDLRYAFVLVDGDHRDESIYNAIEHFGTQMMQGGIICVDNTDWMKFPLDESWLDLDPVSKYKIF